MKRILAGLIVLAGLVVMPGAAFPGGGDSEPVGSLPLSLIHAPSSNPAGNNTIHVWVHCHNMASGYTMSLNCSGQAANIKQHIVTQPWPSTYPGTWDDYNKVSIAGRGFSSGTEIQWAASVVNNADSQHYDSAAVTIQQ